MDISPSEALFKIHLWPRPVDELDQDYGRILCEFLGYEFRKYIGRGSEAILIKAGFPGKTAVRKQPPNPIQNIQEPKEEAFAIKMLLPQPTESKISGKLLGIPDKITPSMYRFLRAEEIQTTIWHSAAGDQFMYGKVPQVIKKGNIENKFPYVVMEYIPCSFMDAMRFLAPISRLSFFQTLLKFIERHLHSYGFAHCDLKPANILVENTSVGGIIPVVLDFSDTWRQQDVRITNPKDTLGTAMYQAPEMGKDARDRDTRSDIFSLGRMLWVIWTGQEPKVEKRLFSSTEISNLFTIESLPLSLRSVFAKTQLPKEYRYQLIEELQKDLSLAMSELMPKLKRSINKSNWRDYVKNREYIPILEKFLAIRETL